MTFSDGSGVHTGTSSNCIQVAKTEIGLSRELESHLRAQRSPETVERGTAVPKRGQASGGQVCRRIKNNLIPAIQDGN
jgi:hypothetical protein